MVDLTELRSAVPKALRAHPVCPTASYSPTREAYILSVVDNIVNQMIYEQYKAFHCSKLS